MITTSPATKRSTCGSKPRSRRALASALGLPFTAEQFFALFADYNRPFVVAVVALWLASIAALAHNSRDPSRRSPRLVPLPGGGCPEDAPRDYPLPDKKLPGGETNPATQQIDFYIRSPQQNPKNRPNRQVFMHFFGMEITWK